MEKILGVVINENEEIELNQIFQDVFNQRKYRIKGKIDKLNTELIDIKNEVDHYKQLLQTKEAILIEKAKQVNSLILKYQQLDNPKIVSIPTV